MVIQPINTPLSWHFNQQKHPASSDMLQSSQCNNFWSVKVLLSVVLEQLFICTSSRIFWQVCKFCTFASCANRPAVAFPLVCTTAYSRQGVTARVTNQSGRALPAGWQLAAFLSPDDPRQSVTAATAVGDWRHGDAREIRVELPRGTGVVTVTTVLVLDAGGDDDGGEDASRTVVVPVSRRRFDALDCCAVVRASTEGDSDDERDELILGLAKRQPCYHLLSASEHDAPHSYRMTLDVEKTKSHDGTDDNQCTLK